MNGLSSITLTTKNKLFKAISISVEAWNEIDLTNLPDHIRQQKHFYSWNRILPCIDLISCHLGNVPWKKAVVVGKKIFVLFFKKTRQLNFKFEFSRQFITKFSVARDGLFLPQIIHYTKVIVSKILTQSNVSL